MEVNSVVNRNKPSNKKRLIQNMIKEMGKDTGKKLIKSLLISGIIFIINILLMSIFKLSDNVIINSLLVQSGNILAGTLLWSIVGILLMNIKNIGFLRAVKSIKMIIEGIRAKKSKQGRKYYVIGIISTFVFSLIFGNIMLSAVVAFTLMSSLGKEDSILIKILSIFISNLNHEDIINSFKGASLSLAIYTLFGSSSFGLGLSIALIVIFLVIAYRTKKEPGGAA